MQHFSKFLGKGIRKPLVINEENILNNLADVTVRQSYVIAEPQYHVNRQLDDR